MPDAELIKTADAITAKARAGYKANTFPGLRLDTIERSYADWDDLLEKPCARLDIVPVSYDDTRLASRTSRYYLNRCDVAVRCKFGPNDRNQAGRIKLELVDRLVLFIEELHDFFSPQPHNTTNADLAAGRLPEQSGAVWKETKILFTYQRERLRTLGLFFGAISLKYEVRKDIALTA